MSRKKLVILFINLILMICFFNLHADDTPIAPANVTPRQASGCNVLVEWEKSSDDGTGNNDVTGYAVYRSVAPSTEGYTKIGTKSAGETSYLDTGTVEGGEYYYTVRAVDGIQESGAFDFLAGDSFFGLPKPFGRGLFHTSPPSANTSNAMLSRRCLTFAFGIFLGIMAPMPLLAIIMISLDHLTLSLAFLSNAVCSF